MNCFAAATAFAPRSGAGNAHEPLGSLDQRIKPLAQRDGHNSVVLAMDHQHWRRDLTGAQIRTKPFHEQPYRHEPIVPRADVNR